MIVTGTLPIAKGEIFFSSLVLRSQTVMDGMLDDGMGVMMVTLMEEGRLVTGIATTGFSGVMRC